MAATCGDSTANAAARSASRVSCSSGVSDGPGGPWGIGSRSWIMATPELCDIADYLVVNVRLAIARYYDEYMR